MKFENPKIKSLTIGELLELEIPDNVKIFEKKNKKILGPFTLGHHRLKAKYGVWIEELVPVFEKLDLMRLSKQVEFEEIKRLKSVTIDDLLNSSTGKELYIKGKDNLLGDMGLIDWEGGTINPMYQEYSRCHSRIAESYDVWVPELEEVFEKLDRLIGS